MRFSSSPHARRFARVVGAVAVGVVLAACSFVTGVPSVDRVELTVPVAVIAPGQSVQASGQAIGSNGNVITHSRRQVRFSSSDETVATVNGSSGLIVGVAPGRATIRATSDDESAEVQITVRPIPVRQVIVSPRSPVVRLAPSTVYGLNAAVIDTNNQALPNRPPTWTSRDQGVVTVSAAGVLTPRGLGTTVVEASVDTGLAPNVGRVTDSVTVRVTPPPILAGGVRVEPDNFTLTPGQTQQFSAALTDSTNAVVTGRTVTWRSGNTNVATVNEVTGVVTAVAAGSVNIIARVERVPGDQPVVYTEDAATLTVQFTPAANVTANITTTTIRVGASQTVVLTVRDANGNELLGRTVFVSTQPDPAIASASISSDGLRSTARITAIAVGTTRVAFQAFRPNTTEPQGTAVVVDVTVTP